MTEQRRAKRIKKEAKVTIELIHTDKLTPDKKITYHVTKDISSSGLRILASTFLPINSLLKIRLSLTKPRRFITAFGKVRWLKGRYGDRLFEMGIEFVDTPQENIKALKEYIEKLEDSSLVS